MATGTTIQTTEAPKKKHLYIFPAFTCERWRGGVYDSDHNKKVPSLNIRQDELLTFDQRVELETRSLVLQYQIRYAEKEYEMLRKEFQKIEETLKQEEASDAEHAFVKPEIPGKQPKKTKTKSDSGASGDETDKSKKGRRGGQKDSKSGSDTEKKGNSTESRSDRYAKRTGSSTSESEGDKGLTSSTESTDEPKAPRSGGGRRRGKIV